MKRLYTYNTFNESVRDNMKPKSDEDVRKSFVGLSLSKKFLKGSEYGVEWAVEIALKNGVDVHLHNDKALTDATDNNHLGVVEMLLKAGADIHVDDDQPLCLAILGGNIDMIKLLLKYGANPHVNNDVPIKLAGNMEDTEMLRTIQEYEKINEGVRDSMKPKSVEDIMIALDTNPKDILKIMRKIRVDESDLYSYIYKTLSKEKIRDVFIDYICDNKEKLRSTDSRYNVGILKNLEDLIGYMNDIHNIDAATSLHSTENGVWDEVTMRLYQELSDEEMKDIIKNAINNEKS